MRDPALQAERGAGGLPGGGGSSPEPTPRLRLGPPAPGRAAVLRGLEPEVWRRLLGWGRGWPCQAGTPLRPSHPKSVLGPHTAYGPRKTPDLTTGALGARPHLVTEVSWGRGGQGRKGCPREGGGQAGPGRLTPTPQAGTPAGRRIDSARSLGAVGAKQAPLVSRSWGAGSGHRRPPSPAGPRGPPLQREAGSGGRMLPMPTSARSGFITSLGPAQLRKEHKTQYILIISLRATSTIVSRWDPVDGRSVLGLGRGRGQAPGQCRDLGPSAHGPAGAEARGAVTGPRSRFTGEDGQSCGLWSLQHRGGARSQGQRAQRVGDGAPHPGPRLGKGRTPCARKCLLPEEPGRRWLPSARSLARARGWSGGVRAAAGDPAGPPPAGPWLPPGRGAPETPSLPARVRAGAPEHQGGCTPHRSQRPGCSLLGSPSPGLHAQAGGGKVAGRSATGLRKSAS